MNNKPWDAIWINCSIATMVENNTPYGLLHHAALAIKDEHIVWIGLMTHLPPLFHELTANIYDMEGRCLTPGLIDCHTHLVYAGNRCSEFILRLEGKNYSEIITAGGGIHATVKATRAASEETLLQQSLIRARALSAEGVTTIEIKSGYGLELETELKILRVAKRIGELLPLTIKKTFLGAHAIPEEFRGHADDYIDIICNHMIPIIAKEKSADYIDVFCENISFNLKQTEQVFLAAKKYHLPIKCHAEQLSYSGSAVLAANYRALSVDHLEHIPVNDIKILANSDTVAVLLPGAFYFLCEKHIPPIEHLRSHGVPIALATDCNPGTSPITSLLLILNMACVLFKLTPEEALLGITRHAAKALGLQSSHGTLEVGKIADFVIWNVSHPAELVYYMGLNVLHEKVHRGVRSIVAST